MRFAALLVVLAAMFSAGCSSGSGDDGSAFDAIVEAQLDVTSEPTQVPTAPPLTTPVRVPSPTPVPVVVPTVTVTATVVPTVVPTVAPTAVPTAPPTPEPTAAPTPVPAASTATPTAVTTPTPSGADATATVTADATGTNGEQPDVTPTRPPLTPNPQVAPSLGLGAPVSGPDPTDANEIYPNPDYDGEVRAVRTASGVVMAVRAGGFGTYDVVTPCHRVARIFGAAELSEAVDVLIDPGHGGNETGAVGANGLTEADVNLRVSKLLQDELASRGISAELTRYANHRVAIQSRAALANALSPRVFLSVHHNGGFPLPFDKPGHEVFFQKGDADAQRLGGLVFEEFDGAFGDIELDWVSNGTRGVSWRTNTRGTDLYGVLRRTPGLVSILTEAMFLTNPPEAELLAQPATLEAEAQALANAIERFFETDAPGTGFIEGLIFQGDLGPGGGTNGCVDPPLLSAG